MRAFRVIARPPVRGFAVAIMALPLLAAGCGGSSPNAGVAHLGSDEHWGATGRADLLLLGAPALRGRRRRKFSACMRSHGEPNFPDPEISSSGGGTSVRLRVTPSSGIDPGSPTFKAAQQACRAFAPGESPGSSSGPQLNAQEQAQVLKLAACIRRHGEPNLPDPSFAGGGVHLPPSVDAHSATFKAAEQACESLIPSSLRARTSTSTSTSAGAGG